MSILSWAFLGLVAGGLANLIFPGDRGAVVMTTIGLGILGSLVGGYLGQTLLGIGIGTVGTLSIGSIVTAVLGAMFFMFIHILIRG